MLQFKDISKAIQNNYDLNALATGVDESGFLIVKGTYDGFGEILFVNRTTCKVVGYEVA
jgi:hypothetical protein